MTSPGVTARPPSAPYVAVIGAGTPVVGIDTWPIEGIDVQDSPDAAVARALELARRPRA